MENVPGELGQPNDLTTFSPVACWRNERCRAIGGFVDVRAQAKDRGCGAANFAPW